MTDVQRLFAEYTEAYPADPSPFLTQVSGRDRAELAALIDAFLERAPRRAFDPEALRSSPAAARGRIGASLAGRLERHVAVAAAAAAAPGAS